jgi:3-isopropylmalate/(R)-2-methylmalate dehydratase large subunit
MTQTKNIIEKIWDQHVVVEKPGYPDVFAIDFQLVHEVTSPQAFSLLESKGWKAHDQKRMIATVDHNVPTSQTRQIITDPASKTQVNALRKNCQKFGVKLLDMDSGYQGIVHVIGPELGITQPGMTIVCGDSHTSTHGAFGAIAFGVGTTEVAQVMATGCLLRQRPKTMKVVFKGQRQPGVEAKDMVLKLISKIGVGGATGHIIEYTGEAIRGSSMEERMTICNMSIECGARAGLVAPDETTFEYLRDRLGVCDFEKAKEYWQTLVSDQGAQFDQVVEIDLNEMKPVVTWGFNPAQGIEISETIPDPAQMHIDDRDSAKAALDYVKLEAGQSLIGVPIDYVFIGSCTNARISDFRAAAKIFKGRKVADGVKVYLVPGSEQVKEEIEKEGLNKIFEQAGTEVRNPGCSMCLAMNEDKVPAGKRCASTSNRNFVGRQGKGSITHLMSPSMAAAAAIEGKIVDVTKMS